MRSRYDFMVESEVRDIDNEKYPDPLTIDYQAAVTNTNLKGLPSSYSLNFTDLHKLWVKYYKETRGKVDMDDIIYSINGIAHVGMLEPEDSVYLFDPETVKTFTFAKHLLSN